MLNLKVRKNTPRTKKIRGVERKLNLIQRESEKGIVVHDKPCYNGYHKHLDWDGVGSMSDEARMSTLTSHATLFKNVIEQLIQKDYEFQSFIFLDKKHPHLDSVFILSESGKSEDPFIHRDNKGDSEEIQYVQKIINQILPEYNMVAIDCDDSILMYAKGLGTPIQHNFSMDNLDCLIAEGEKLYEQDPDLDDRIHGKERDELFKQISNVLSGSD